MDDVAMMTTTKPRINVILEEPLYEIVEELAQRDGMSLPRQISDLGKGAVE